MLGTSEHVKNGSYYSFNKYLCGTYHMPGNGLIAGDIKLSESNMVSALYEFIV